VVQIADTVRKGKNVRVNQKDGIIAEHGDMVKRSRLMIEARKWRLAWTPDDQLRLLQRQASQPDYH
jgi:hypothetical protein